MLEKCEGIPKDVHIKDMPNSIVHSDLSKTVCKVLQRIGANRIVPRPQQKKAMIQYWNFSEEWLGTGDKGQEGLKIFKSNWFRFSGRDMSIHKSQLVSLLQGIGNDLFRYLSIYLSIYLSMYLSICLYIYLFMYIYMYIYTYIYIYIYYVYIIILFVLCILSIAYIYKYAVSSIRKHVLGLLYYVDPWQCFA